MKGKGKIVLLAALLAASLLAGSFLALFPLVWENRREQEKERELLALIREMSVDKAGKMEEKKEKGAETGNGCGGGETVAEPPAASEAEEITASPDQEECGEGQWMFPEENEAAVQGQPEEKEEEPQTADVPEETAGIGILAIPKIDAELPVTAGVSEEQLKVSEGWLVQSSPIGSKGNAVIAGHRSYTYGRHFNRLGELEAGDEIFYTGTEGERMRFIVNEILVTEPEDPAVFDLPPEGGAQLTLYTCTPVRTASHRLIVRAGRVMGGKEDGAYYQEGGFQ